mgnify:CR=1 FL=1
MQPYAMNYYLVIGVQRSPNDSPDDPDSFQPASIAVSSEEQLKMEQLEEAFEKGVNEDWELEEGQVFWNDDGYKHLDYVLVSNDPFPDSNIYGPDLANDYLGS